MMYSVALKLDGEPVVVVGGGRVAASKLGALLAAGARVTVIAPDIVDEIRSLSLSGTLTVNLTVFDARQLDGARWVVAAATRDVNRAVAAAAAARGLFVNVVDDPELATAYLPAVVRRGDVELAISTGGVAPALAALLREALDAILPDELDQGIEVAAAERARHRRDRVAFARRRPLLLRALERIYAARPA